jgi:hypothetical protein
MMVACAAAHFKVVALKLLYTDLVFTPVLHSSLSSLLLLLLLFLLLLYCSSLGLLTADCWLLLLHCIAITR